MHLPVLLPVSHKLWQRLIASSTTGSLVEPTVETVYNFS